MSTIRLEVRRRLRADEVAEVASLQEAAVAAGTDQPLGEQTWLDLDLARHRDDDAGGDDAGGSGDILARRADDWSLVGVAHLHRDETLFSAEVLVGPAAGGAGAVEPAEVRRALLTEARALVGRLGGGTLQYWVHDATGSSDRQAVDLGFELARSLRQMRVGLPLPGPPPRPPPGTTLRPFRVGADEAAWVAVNNRAFAGHPEQGGWDVATLRRRQALPWFDPAGFLVAEDDDGRLLGSCWTKVHRDADPPMGEIYVISVDPALHQRGLGRFLTVAGLAHLAGAGLGIGMLYVDDANRAAVALYSSLGFETHHVDHAYAASVAPAGGQWTDTPTNRPIP
jgi:mycothiol synthase